MGRPLLIVSGIRGDRWALEAVLSAASRSNFSGVLAVGDHCFGGPHPFETWARLQELGATLIRGDTDVLLGCASADDLIRGQTANWAQSWQRCRSELGDLVVRRLTQLPSTAVISLDGFSAGVMAVHGKPFAPWDSNSGHLLPEALIADTASVAEDALVMACHANPFIQRVDDVLVINCSPVGRYYPDVPEAKSTVHAVLIQEFSDGIVRAQGQTIRAEESVGMPFNLAKRWVG